MNADGTPPGWAEGLLRVSVRARDFDSVSGDLLEEYRESVRPARGQRRADAWYARQVIGFVFRSAWLWATMLAAAFAARTALDWLVPTTDFLARSRISTLLAAGILLLASGWAAWRSGSLASGPLFGVAVAVLAVPMKMGGAAVMLALWHDPVTMSAIRGSGGLEEVFTLPLAMLLPAAVLGLAGGAAGRAASTLRSA
jgi:hypothetical protein